MPINSPPAQGPPAKLQTPAFMAVLNELNVSLDQLTKRRRLIGEIEQTLNAKYNSNNRLMSYIMRVGHNPVSQAQPGLYVAEIART